MRILFTVFLASATFCSFAGNGVKKSPLPNWVKPISPDNPVIREGNGGYQYLLIDLQENLITQSTFRHYVIKVLSTEGIRSVSDIDISFDPTYQTLSFHELKIIRDTKTIDKLQVASIQTLQRETSMERQLYDGSISAVINLDDVREGDIIEYSFSLQGFTASIGEILRSIVVAAIWIPYFNISERVKSTFCKTRNIRPQENSPKAEDW